MVKSKCFKIEKSDIEEEAVREVKFPDIEVPAMIRLRAYLMLITLSLNLI